MSRIFPNQTQSTYLENGLSWDITGYKTPTGKGVYGQHIYSYNIVPWELDDDLIAGNASGGAGTQTPYQTTVILPDQGTQTPTIVYALNLRTNGRAIIGDNNSYVVLDCLRVPFIHFAGASVATIAYIIGVDNNFKVVINKISIAAGTTADTYFTKSFLMVKEIYFTANPGVQVSVGFGNKFGLPHFVPKVNYIQSLTWNGAALATNTFTPGFIWRQTSTDPLDPAYGPTVLTGDAHGIINLSAQGSLPNRARMLSVNYYIYGTDNELSAAVSNAADLNNPFYGTSAVLQVDLQQNESATAYVTPYLVEQDWTGAQYPADNVFMDQYRAALAQ